MTVETGDEETRHLVGKALRDHIADLEKRMREAAADLEFEEAARLRDEIKRLETRDLELKEAPETASGPAALAARIRRADAHRKSGKGKYRGRRRRGP